MRSKESAGWLGFAVLACAACCAGPILGLFAAIGIATVLGVLAVGATGLLIAVVGVLAIVRRRQRAKACATSARSVPVAMPDAGRRQ